MRVLCVAEKPSIARSISQILSGGQLTTHNTQTNYIKNYEFNYPQTQSFFIVTCVSGHLTAVDFYETHRKWNACDSFDLFDAPVEIQVASDKKAIEQNLLTQARRADVLMIWTDCDREGEHIGMEVAKVCRKAKPTIRIKRARFSAIIPQQIHNAAQHPVELDKRQADAVEARIILDLKVGAAFTRLQTLTLQNRVQQIAEGTSIVSYGPCQFPTLGFVVQRYAYVKVFQPENFWYIYLSLTRETSQGEEETKFNWKRAHSFEHFAVMRIFLLIKECRLARVTKVNSKITKKWKPLPLTTVELQKAGSRLLRLAPKKVLDIAEKLYQQGFVSYPRTETDQFDSQFDFMTLIEKQTADPAWGTFATSLQQGGFSVPRKGKNDDKAHPPIHPTAHAGNLVGDEKRVYEYITRRFLACCSKDAEGWQTTVDLVYGGEEFSATGLIVREKNYLIVFTYDKWVGHHIPIFEEGEEFEPTVCELREGQTSKPKYLTEADLVTLMDKNGIGTDATIAQHIQTIIDRDYVIERMEGGIKYLIPSTLGIGLIEGYNQIGLAKNVSKPQLRRETERRMVQVCEGTRSKHDMIVRSLEQYKNMYVIVKREFEKVTSSVVQHLAGHGGAQNGPAGGGGEDGGGGGGGGGGPGGGGGRGGRGGGGGRGGWGGGRGGRGGATNRGGRTFAVVNTSSVSDLKDNSTDTPAYRNPLSRQSGPSSSTGPSRIVRPGYTVPPTTPIASSSPPISCSRKAGSSSTVSKPTSSRTTSTANASKPAEVQCLCNRPAVLKTVVRETVSKGRSFWRCSNHDGCSFFDWADEGVASDTRTPTANVSAKRPYSTTQDVISDSAVRKCKCNEEGILIPVMKETANKGRKFWSCRSAGCGFFEWDDEPPRTESQGIMASRGESFNARSGPGSECFKCNQEGHWANECPNDGNNSKKRPKSFGSSTNDNVAATCYKCQEAGHYSSACPNGAKKSESKPTFSENNAGDECFKCGKSGHWSDKCPQNKVSSNSKISGTGKRGRGGSSSKAKRGGKGGKKKAAYAAADEY